MKRRGLQVGDLVSLDPHKWETPYALVVGAPRRGFTDTDFMGRPYVWISVDSRVIQVPQSHVMGVV